MSKSVASMPRYGMNVADVQTAVTNLIGGENLGEAIDGRALSDQSALSTRIARQRCAICPALPRTDSVLTWVASPLCK